MASIMQGQFGSFSTPAQQVKSPFTLDYSTPKTGFSAGSNMGTVSGIATSLIGAWSTYTSAKIAAKNLEGINKTNAALQKINNTRVAIKQGLQIYAQNETAQEARSVLVNKKLDADVVAMQTAGQLAVQQAFLGQSGGSAERVGLQGEIDALRIQDNIAAQRDSVNATARVNSALLRIGATNAMGTAQAQAVQQPSAVLAAFSGLSDVLSIGSQIKGG